MSRIGYSRTLAVTATSVCVLVTVAVVVPRSDSQFGLMRPVYLGLLGWLVAIAVRRTDRLEKRLVVAEHVARRHRIVMGRVRARMYGR